jgi:hypothetical protein
MYMELILVRCADQRENGERWIVALLRTIRESTELSDAKRQGAMEGAVKAETEAAEAASRAERQEMVRRPPDLPSPTPPSSLPPHLHLPPPLSPTSVALSVDRRRGNETSWTFHQPEVEKTFKLMVTQTGLHAGEPDREGFSCKELNTWYCNDNDGPLFEQWDTDGDGIVTLPEWCAHLRADLQAPKQRSERSPSAASPDRVRVARREGQRARRGW